MSGLGEAYWGTGLRPVFDDLLAPQLVGENPLEIDRLVTLLTTRWGGTHAQNGLVMAAISGLEIALWDLAGKLTGLPAYRLLGGTFRDRVRPYTLISVEPASGVQERPDTLDQDGSCNRRWDSRRMVDGGLLSIPASFLTRLGLDRSSAMKRMISSLNRRTADLNLLTS